MGRAARRRRQNARKPGAPAGPGRTAAGDGQNDDPRSRAQAAVTRLVRTNPPGKASLAGAYALGFAALGMAQAEGDEPEWFAELDPLDTLFLGTVWPRRFSDGYEYGNALTAVAMLAAAGICPAWIYAYQHTDGLLPRPDGSFASENQRLRRQLANALGDRRAQPPSPGKAGPHEPIPLR